MKKKWCVPCLRGVVGNWVYYSALMKPEQIAKRIMTSKEIREAKALEDFLQRALKPRVTKIASYLKRRDDRFFNSIIIGVFDGLPDWVQFDLSVLGEKLGVPEVTEAQESLGLLLFFGTEKMFAIDGQHRVEGIKQAFETAPEHLQKDEFPVIFIAHKDDAVGKVRTRRLFCDINKNAVAVAEGDKVVIDEDDLCAIVARRLYAEYPAFKNGAEIAVTEKKEQLTKDGQERFTSLLAIYSVTRRLKKLFKKPRGTLESESENVTAFQAIVTGFFDFVIQQEPSLKRYFKQHATTPAAERANNKNLFFRPIGLELLARLYAHFRAKNKIPTLAWGLKTLPFENPRGILDGIVWNSGRIEATGKARNAALRLCLYLLHETTKKEETELTTLLRELKKSPDYHLPPKPPLAVGA